MFVTREKLGDVHQLVCSRKQGRTEFGEEAMDGHPTEGRWTVKARRYEGDGDALLMVIMMMMR